MFKFTEDILVGFCPIDLALEEMCIRDDPGPFRLQFQFVIALLPVLPEGATTDYHLPLGPVVHRQKKEPSEHVAQCLRVFFLPGY